MAQHHKQTVLIADDHPVFRYGLRQLIEADPNFEVLGEASDGETALEMIKDLKPSIAIVDINMPKLDGLALAQKLRDLDLPVMIVFLTMYHEKTIFRKAIEISVKGYVLKDAAATDIIICLNGVAAGQNYTSPELTTYLIKRLREVEAESGSHSGLETLTESELRVLSLIADYKTTKEIAQELFVSARTIDTHRNNICKKVGVHGTHALMKFALDHIDLLPKAKYVCRSLTK